MLKTNSQTSNRKWFTRTLLAPLLGLAVAACNNNVEAFLTYNFGWQDIPTLDRTLGEQMTATEDYADSIAATNLALEQAFVSHNLPSVAVAVGKDGDVLWSRSMGYADFSTQTPVNLSTSFRIGSTAKALTGTLAAKLQNDGLFDLDGPISSLVPYFPNGDIITSRQLLTHTAGIRHYRGDEYYNKRDYESVEAAVKVFADDPLQFAPGVEFSYSTYGFVLASAAMEGAMNRSFDELISTHLARPLNMENTMREGLADGAFAAPYEIRGSEYKSPFPISTSNRTAGGGFVSTPTDLVRMTQAILSGDYISEDLATELFFTPQKLSNGEVNIQSYALGWRAHQSERFSINGEAQFVAHHYGKALGGESFLVMYPAHHLSISIVTNRNLDEISILMDLAHDIAERIVLEDQRQADTSAKVQ